MIIMEGHLDMIIMIIMVIMAVLSQKVPFKKKRKLREKWVFPRVTAIIVLSPLINSGADKK